MPIKLIKFDILLSYTVIFNINAGSILIFESPSFERLFEKLPHLKTPSIIFYKIFYKKLRNLFMDLNFLLGSMFRL